MSKQQQYLINEINKLSAMVDSNPSTNNLTLFINASITYRNLYGEQAMAQDLKIFLYYIKQDYSYITVYKYFYV